MKKSYLLILFLAIGCASQKKLSENADRTLLFPSGIYTHDVQIETQEKQNYSFRSLVKISPEKILIVGLSPFQSTVFKIEEDRKSRAVQTEVYEERLKKHQKELVELYSVLSVFLTLPKNGKDPRIQTLEKNPEGILTRFKILNRKTKTPIEPPIEPTVELKHFDENGIADEIFLKQPKFDVRVKVVQYEG